VRHAVHELLSLGGLPSENTASENELALWEEKLALLPSPLTTDEARALAGLLGEDYCFGLAWTLIHAIETAGTDVVDGQPDREREPARWSLWQSARNAARE
jgi:hypothetical protein